MRLASKLLGPLLGRPSESELTALARDARPAPPIEVPRPGPDHLAEGRRAFDEGRYGEALHHFNELRELAPDSAWAWHGRGDALQLLGEHAGALEAYDQAVQLAPRTGIHHGGRANALRSLGRSEDAKTALQQALELDASLSWMRP